MIYVETDIDTDRHIYKYRYGYGYVTTTTTESCKPESHILSLFLKMSMSVDYPLSVT